MFPPTSRAVKERPLLDVHARRGLFQGISRDLKKGKQKQKRRKRREEKTEKKSSRLCKEVDISIDKKKGGS